jgi:cellulose biosynthesis protein BcsQ
VLRQLGEVEARAKELEAAQALSEDKAAARERILRDMRGSLTRLREELGDYDRKLRASANRVRHALKLEGLIWEEKVLHNAPKFARLDKRSTPVISLLNLKGGVGKTTVTANMGAALAHLGYRVLLVDLDLQGSLTNLFLAEGEQQRLYHDRRLLQNFLDAAAEDLTTKLLDYGQPILGGRSSLVATADTLAYTELNLTFKWLLRIGKRDPRFLLRKALHLKQVTSRYDVVLLDCPPLMNVSCVNALAASDYVLVPVMPSKQAMGRVPALLHRLKSFRDNINGDLQVLGVLANRTQRSVLTSDESNLWTGLSRDCRNEWGVAVPMFQTIIRQSATIRDIEDACRPLQEGDEMFPAFTSLAAEVEQRLPALCLPAARRAERKGVSP